MDCSLAIVDGPATAYSHGAESRRQINTLAHHTVVKRVYGGWQHNYYSQQRQPGRAKERSISLDVYG